MGRTRRDEGRADDRGGVSAGPWRAARDSVFDLAMNHFPPGPQGPGGCEFMPERLEILKNCEADCIFRKHVVK